jgi:hypothetical protein
MRSRIVPIVALTALAALLAAEAAYAHGPRYGHHPHRSGARVGVFIGAPLVGYGWYGPRPWYPPAYYYAPPAYVVPAPVVVAPPAPTVYVERSPETASGSFWYYCPDTQAYYPYVSRCASPWERVAPQPPS